MQLFPKQLLTEEFTYYSDKPVDDLRLDMQQVFEKTKGFNFFVNLAGEFTSSYAFEVKPKYQFGSIKGFKGDAAYLVGKINQVDNNNVQVDVLVKPNSMFVIGFFVCLVWGLFRLLFVHGQSTQDIIIDLVFVFVAPVVIVVVAHFAKAGIKNRFVKVFILKESKHS